MVDTRRAPIPAAVQGAAFGTPMRLAFVYIRVSQAHDDMFSPEQQRLVCEKYAVENNIKIVEEIPDLDLSGRSFTKRKVMSMIERIRAGEANTILIWQYSRWARNAGLGIEYINTLEAAGGELIAVTEDADTKTTSGKFMRGIHLLFAEHYSNMVGDNWRLTHERRLKNGLAATGRTRFGYTRCPDCTRNPERPTAFLFCKSCKGVPLVDETRRGPIADAYDMYLAGKGFERLAHTMQDRGVRSIDGYCITNVGWQKILDSGFSAGFICQDPRPPALNGKRPTPSIEHYIWYAGAHDAIIPEDTWTAYKDKRLANRKKNSSRIYVSYRVSGLFRCGENIIGTDDMCLGSMVSKKTSSVPYPVFTCTTQRTLHTCVGTRVGMPMMEAAIKEWLAERAEDDGTALLAMQHSAAREDSQDRIKGLQAEADTLNRHSAKLLDAFMADLIDLQTFGDRKKELADALQVVEEQLEIAGYVLKSTPPKPEEFVGILALWDLLTPQELNEALSKVIAYVIAKRPVKGKHRVDYTFVPRWLAEPINWRGRLKENRGANPGNRGLQARSDMPPDR